MSWFKTRGDSCFHGITREDMNQQRGAQEFCDEEALMTQEWDATWVRMQNVKSTDYADCIGVICG